MNADVLRSIKRIEQDFHRRAFGEEMARVNFLPVAQRRAYVARLRRRAAAAKSKRPSATGKRSRDAR